MVTRFEHYGYELTPCPADQGGGWLLRLLADDQELGRRVFPPVGGIEDARQAAEAAHDEALSAVTAWLASIESRPPADRPRPADESGMYLLMPDDWLLVPPRPPGPPERVVIDWPDQDTEGGRDA